ncbi:MAG: putative nucleotidyltransferase substrate binding domain-containing protein [Bacteroidota bacterium]
MSITERIEALLAATEPFNLLTEEQRAATVPFVSTRIYAEGAVILEQGVDTHKALYIVESGLVRLLDAQQQRLIEMCGENTHFGAYGLTAGGILPYEARAVEATVCALVDAERFWALLKQNADFKAFFDENLKRFVRTRETDRDAAGAYLLFDTTLGELLHQPPVTCPPNASIRTVARAMRDYETETVVIMKEGLPMGLVTEGDIATRVVAAGRSAEDPVTDLITRPPVALNTEARLFEGIQVMMQHRIRRVMVMSQENRDGERALAGVITAQDVSHFRGLDPVATVERTEKAQSVEELAAIRSESTRRLLRHVITELDDQLKARLFFLVERDLHQAEPDAASALPWVWLAFGTPGRRECALTTWQSNGLVYDNPSDAAEAERAAAWFALLAQKIEDAFEACGFVSSEEGIVAFAEPFRQPLSAWQAAYRQWASGTEATATRRAAPCFDFRALYGHTALADTLRDTIRQALAGTDAAPRPGIVRLLLDEATSLKPPFTMFGRRLVREKAENGEEGLNLRERGLRPIVGMARALALDLQQSRRTSTFGRLRFVADEVSDIAAEARSLTHAFTTLVDLHVSTQMRAVEVGEKATDWVDPEALSRSQQNLLKEAFRTMGEVQESLRQRYNLR